MVPLQGNQWEGFPQATLILLRVSSCGILGTLFSPDWQLKRRISFPPGGVIHHRWGWLLLGKQFVNKTKENVLSWHTRLMRHHSSVSSPVFLSNDKAWWGVFGFFCYWCFSLICSSCTDFVINLYDLKWKDTQHPEVCTGFIIPNGFESPTSQPLWCWWW